MADISTKDGSGVKSIHSPDHSYRNAWIGSSRAALTAGNRPAMTPTQALKITATNMATGVMTGEFWAGETTARSFTTWTRVER